MPTRRTSARPVTPIAFAQAVLLAALALGCHGGSSDPPGTAPSTQAVAEPAPFASPPNPTSVTSAGPDAGPSPEPFRGDEELAADVPRELLVRDAGPRDARDTRELAGYAIQAVLRSGEGPAPPRAPEVNVAAIDALRRRTEARVAIELSPSRARFVFTGGFVLPQGTELRARFDRYGHLLLWPGENTYRVAQPGSLRALLGERRLDVAPMARASANGAGEGPLRFALRTRRVDVTTRAAKATLELGTLRDADAGGALVCRFLLDLMSASPETAVCGEDEVPLHAELRWTTQGALTFDVTSIARRSDLVAQDLEAPPASLALALGPPPPSPAETIIQRPDLVVFRTAAVEFPAPAPSANASGANGAASPVPMGLLLLNSTDELRVAWLDGVPTAWVAPGERLVLPSLVHGRYELEWRTFLGDGWDPPSAVVVPGTSETGGRIP